MLNLNQPVLPVLGLIWGLLFIASLIVFTLQRIHPDKNYSELSARTKSWWVMIGIFTLAMISGKKLSILFLGLVSFLALKEYFSMIPTRRADRRVLFWCYLAIPVQYYLVYIEWYGTFIIFIPVYMFLFIPARLLLAKQTDGFIRSAGTIQWGLMMTVFTLSHAAYLNTLPVHGSTKAAGAGLLLYLVFLTQANDVAQYVWGKLWGKHKVIELVSPKKTWEGLLGGVCSTTVLAILIAPYLTPFSVLIACATGALIGIAGFFGDITISAVKRDIGIKDTGSLIPGHGGILDRIDSLTFTAPLFFHFVWYMYY